VCEARALGAWLPPRPLSSAEGDPIVPELEAKFLMAPGARPDRVLRRLQESLAWAGFRVQPVQRRHQLDTYYDTVEQQLRRAGWSYRQREADTTRIIALKEINRARAAIFNRTEVEQALPLTADDDARWPPPGAVQNQLRVLLSPGAQLTPLFTVATERAIYRVTNREGADGALELAFDRSTISADESMYFIEIELELLEGPYDLLADALAVAELEPGLLNARLSKYERGLIMARCAAPDARPRLRLGDRSSGLEIASDYLKKQLIEIKGFETYAWEGLHVEGVHRMRVAARRAAATLTAFAAVLPAESRECLTASLSRLIKALGRVRDLDIHLAQIDDYRSLLAPHHHARLRRYERQIRIFHREARRNLLFLLNNNEYKNLAGEFRALLVAMARAANGASVPVAEAARPAIRDSLERVLRRGPAERRKSTASELHRLRIAAKRLRYLLECVQVAYGDRLDDVMQALKALQDRLGAFQDARLALDHLEYFRRGHAETGRERRVLAQLIRFEKARARAERKALPDDWLRFRTAAADLPARL
jgi:triphosphatase